MTELEPILRAWWEECNQYKEYGVPLDIDYEYFVQSYRQGEVLIVVAREDDKIVSATVLQITSNPIIKDLVQTITIAWWLDPEYRTKDNIEHLLNTIEECSVNLGANMNILSMANVKQDSPMGKWLKRKGYRSSELVMCKVF